MKGADLIFEHIFLSLWKNQRKKQEKKWCLYHNKAMVMVNVAFVYY